MAKHVNEWQKHVGPFLSRAIKQARKSFKPKSGLTPKKRLRLKQMRKKRDQLNTSIRSLKG